MPKIDPEARASAAQCRHYAMCKIDYLATGLCPSGPEKHFVTYYPQGRMDLYRGLAEGRIPVTEALLESADTCTLCGVCDPQCHFATGLQPTSVMRALKDYVEDYRRENGPVVRTAEDEGLRRIREIVGRDWATNDPAVLWTYADDPFPLAAPQTPRYVVLPGIAGGGRRGRPPGRRARPALAIRGNGGSVFGFVFTDGIVLDMNRMRKIEFDLDNWVAAVEPGVTSFELQQEACRRGLRVNAAEPAATVCGNLVCTGTFSTWSNVYGTAADNFVDMEFVGRDGRVFRLNDKRGAEPFRLRAPRRALAGRLHQGLRQAPPDDRRRGGPARAVRGPRRGRPLRPRARAEADRAGAGRPRRPLRRDLSRRPTRDWPAASRPPCRRSWGSAMSSSRSPTGSAGRPSGRWPRPSSIPSLLRLLMLGLPRLVEPRWLDLVREYEGAGRPFELLCRPEMRPVVEAVLQPSPETISASVPEGLRPFYRELYARPEMTDMVWLNMHRIVSARMSRRKHMIAFLVYVPLDRLDVIHEVLEGFGRVAGGHGIDHDFGFLTPMDLGKRAILEYDYYIDHTDPAEKEKIARAMPVLDPWLDALAARIPGVLSLKYVFSQGCSRKDNFLYRV